MKLNARELMEDNRVRMDKPQREKMNPKLLMLIGAIMLVIIAIIVVLYILQEITPPDTSIKLYINSQKIKNFSADLFVVENDEIYANVKKFAELVGYEAHSGEYKIDAEDSNKVFVQNKYETASIFLNSTTISKVYTNSSEEYKDYTMSKPAKRIGEDIYVTLDGIKTACNVSIGYDAEKYTMNVGTLEYNYTIYNTWAQQNGYQQVSNDFENAKAILYDRVVVKNADGRYGVINSKNEEVIGTRYSNIEFDEYTQEFTITNNSGKMGIDFINGETKINVIYDEIKSIQKENELYLVKNNNKYGIIDSKSRIVIHQEYDDIGVDISPYITTTTTRVTTTPTPVQNEINDAEATPTVVNFVLTNTKNSSNVKQYIMFDSVIPVKQDGKYGFFDIKGNKIVEVKYTGVGCYAKPVVKTNNKEEEEEKFKKTTTNLLEIEDYELIVVENNEKFGLINTEGKEIVRVLATDMYSTVSAGVKSYYMLYENNVINLEKDLFEPNGIKKKSEIIEEKNKEEENQKKEQTNDNTTQENTNKSENDLNNTQQTNTKNNNTQNTTSENN